MSCAGPFGVKRPVISFVKYFPTDISIAVIDLLQEMTDVDTLNESEEGATALIDALVSFFPYLFQENTHYHIILLAKSFNNFSDKHWGLKSYNNIIKIPPPVSDRDGLHKFVIIILEKQFCCVHPARYTTRWSFHRI